MKRTKEEIINAKTFLKAAAKYYGVDFADEINLIAAAIDEIETLEEEPNPFELPKALPDDVFYESLEEPKQDLEKEMFDLEQELDIPSHLRWHNSKPKQETLEEAAANLADPNLCKTDNWIAGAKWQQERMYSEEEVYNLLEEAMKDCYDEELEYHYDGDYKNLKEWFKQFKKNKMKKEKEKKMYVKCINNKWLEKYLTVGDKYLVRSRYVDPNGNIMSYLILDDSGAWNHYSPALVEPCSLSTKDPIVEEVKELFDKRSQLGIEKYGTTLYDNNTDDFLLHALEEAMDLCLYLAKIRSQIKNK